MQATPAQQPLSPTQGKYTPGPWNIVKSFNGFVITRAWTSGLHQRLRTGHLRSKEEAQAALKAHLARAGAAA
ncbi:hypothetical protein [Alicycliphilus denitrificans]|uniref:hypothetical protein n=1 Tax=Alicycliphilus denitrificans TaxID=179636 RepID=UPI0001DA0DEB|nr:hypothetical protein [Alicycliphilus denitrificans]ADV01287.1 hypothetical protein Alide_3570 [Alicycliphilus denitrificans BC]